MKKIFLYSIAVIVSLSLLQRKEVIAEDQISIDSYIKRLSSNKPDERQKAVLDLFNLVDERTIAPIAQALNDPDPYVRYTAAWSLNPQHMDIIDGYTDYGKGVNPLSIAKSKKLLTLLIKAPLEEDSWARKEIASALIEHQRYQLGQGLQLNRNVQAVVLNLIKDPHPDIRYDAAEALLRWERDAKVEKAFREALLDKSWKVRRVAVIYFSQDIKVLREALKDNYYMVRWAAADILGLKHSSNPLTAELLTPYFDDPHISVRIVARRILDQIEHRKAVKLLLASHEKYPHEISKKYIEEVAGKTFEEVEREYQDEMKDFQFKKTFIKKRDTKRQMQSLKSGDQFAELTALLYLSWVPLPEKLEILLQGIKGKDPLIKYHSIEMLWYDLFMKYYPPEKMEVVYDSLKKATKDTNPHVRRAAIRMLGIFVSYETHNARVIDFIQNIIRKEEDPFIRHASIELIGDKDPETSLKGADSIFLKLINDEFTEIRKIAIDEIPLRCYPDAFDSIFRALKDPYSRIRLRATQQLGFSEIIPESEFMEIQSTLKNISENDPSELVRKNASRSFNSNELYFTTKKPVVRSHIHCN